MKKLLFYAVLILLLMIETEMTSAQSPESKICPDPSKNSADSENIVLTVCTHESGMAPLIQPRLYFLLFKDGQAEFETEPFYDEKIGGANSVLLLKKFQVDRKDAEIIGRLLSQTDFKNADPVYPKFQIWTDSSLKSTIFANLKGQEKKIVVNNFSIQDKNNKSHYPPSLLKLLEKVNELRAENDKKRFNQTEPEIIDYAGKLEVEQFYRASVEIDKNQNLILVRLPKVPLHHVASIEWINEQKFVGNPGSQIVFRVISKDVKLFRQNLWVTRFVCEIIKIENDR